MKLLDYEGLRAKGITYSRTQLYRLIKAGKFPKPLSGFGKGHAWPETEIDDLIASRIAERDAEAA